MSFWWATKEDLEMIRVRLRKDLMAEFQQVLDATDAVRAAVDAAAERVIADLSGTITPEQLDALVAQLDGIKTAADAIDA